MLEYCQQETREEIRERIIETEIRRETRRNVCHSRPWPLSLFCTILVEILFLIEIIVIPFIVLVTITTCVVCQVGYIFVGHRIISDEMEGGGINGIPSIHPRRSQNAEMWNNADVDSRFDHIDSGEKYQFTINADGKVYFKTPELTDHWQILKHNQNEYDVGPLKEREGPLVISYTKERPQYTGKHNIISKNNIINVPKFDMIAASSGRILVKEQNKANFYFTTMEDEFLDPKAEDNTPGFYFKLDPQHNMSNTSLKWWTKKDYDHPSLDSYEFVHLGKGPKFGMVLVALGLSLALFPVIYPISIPLIISGLTVSFLQGMLQDYMQVRVHPRVWHLLDTRPPFDSGAPPNIIESFNHVTYGGRYAGGCEQRHQKSIKIYGVLDIAVGHMHRHLHYEDIYGGEMDSMDVRIYDMLNGPVDDAGGFCDGTCNFYILCKIKVDADNDGVYEQDSYGILWIDEQSYFSERWRLLHHIDYKSAKLRDWKLMGKNSGIRDPSNEKYRFNPNFFWCPFEDSWYNEFSRIDDTSRMRVARQTVIVTGKDPEEGDVIYSINFSWGTSDRTWRWRRYPDNCEVNLKDHVKMPTDGSSYCFSDTIAIREDMTIHMEGLRWEGDKHEEGYWYQKYLPADNIEVPSEDKLELNKMPDISYFHEWGFISEKNFQQVNSFSHFGIYENVNSRSQYYVIEKQNNDFYDDEFIPWKDSHNQLFALVGKPPFRFCPPSKFNSHTYLKIVKRAPLGWLAMHWDKRDDELSGFFNKKATLTSHSHMVLDDPSNYPPVSVDVLLSERRKNWTPPVVQMVKIIVNKNENKILIIFYSRRVKSDPKRKPQSENVFLLDEEEYAPKIMFDDAMKLHREPTKDFEDFSNYLSVRYSECIDPVFPDPHIIKDNNFYPDTSIWRLAIGGFDIVSETVKPTIIKIDLWDDTRNEFRFKRKSRYLYFYEWVSQGPEDKEFEKVMEYCAENGCRKHCTSVWFEDFTGHVNTAEKTLFVSSE